MASVQSSSNYLLTQNLSDPQIANEVAADLQGGALSYSSVLSILENAAIGGMTAAKFGTLQTFAAELDAAGGISVSPYVQEIADDVISGNSANATWNGGSSTASALGNLSASSSQLQADELIGEWFLGTNLPSLNLSSVGEANLNPTYQTSTLPLYGPSGAPTYKDVAQGYLGDCYFLAALGEVALQDPAAIEDMIASNGNGTYAVRFFVNGQADYVTVNAELPVMSGYQWANGSKDEFANATTDDWVALVEKAYAELNAQTNALHGMELSSASDSYAGIAAGDGSALTLITDQSETPISLSPRSSPSALAGILSSVTSSLEAGEEVLMSTPANSNGNLVGDHMYMVTGYNAATGAFSIQNPWGSAYSGPLAMSFAESLSQLAADNATLWVTSGNPQPTENPVPAAVVANADILWQNVSGQAAIWDMNGTNVVGGGSAGSNPGPGWSAVGTGDFNADGSSDILWQNTDGQAAIWEMNGTNVTGGGLVGPNPGAGWTVVGTGDFNGDDFSDILWQNANGQAAIWEMNGTNVIGGGDVGPNPGPGWTAVGTGDFNGDGNSDIVWQNAAGQVSIWEMSGTNIIGGGELGANPGPDWKVIGTGDFNGDGASDIVLQNSVSGQAAEWEMNGTSIIGGGVIAANPGTGWKVVGAEDFNGDGISDLLWQNTASGQAVIWDMNGTSIAGGGELASNPGASWHAIRA
jgi:hypothetical protein